MSVQKTAPVIYAVFFPKRQFSEGNKPFVQSPTLHHWFIINDCYKLNLTV